MNPDLSNNKKTFKTLHLSEKFETISISHTLVHKHNSVWEFFFIKVKGNERKKSHQSPLSHKKQS